MTVQSYSVVGQHSLDGTGSPVYAKQGLSAVSGVTLHFFAQSLLLFEGSFQHRFPADCERRAHRQTLK